MTEITPRRAVIVFNHARPTRSWTAGSDTRGALAGGSGRFVFGRSATEPDQGRLGPRAPAQGASPLTWETDDLGAAKARVHGIVLWEDCQSFASVEGRFVYGQ
jgi:hypothetical protein